LQFLKRHYEKIILAVLLLLFIASLIYLIQIIDSTNDVTKADLNIPRRAADYEETDFTKEAFSTESIFMKDTQWKVSEARDPADKSFTDLINPFECARCPHCGRIVPLRDFKDEPHKCPVCNGELRTPLAKAVITSINPPKEGDANGNGIPDIIEEKLGWDPKDPESGLSDLAGDGFSSVFKYKYFGSATGATAITNPKMHPPMYMRLHVLALRKTLLDVILKKVVPAGTKGDEFDIQLAIEGGAKTLFKVLNDKVTLDKKPYEIVKVMPKFTKLQQGSVIIEKDESRIVLNSVDGKYTLEMKVGEPVYSPNPKAIVKDDGIDEELTLDENDIFPMGTEKTGITRYKVTKIDIEKEKVELKDLKTNKVCVISKTPLMPKPHRKGGGFESSGPTGAPPGQPATPGSNIGDIPLPK
jgi:hypothetical protein